MDHARTMYDRGAPYGPGKTISHNINQVYLWNQESIESAREQIELWRSEAPDSTIAGNCHSLNGRKTAKTNSNDMAQTITAASPKTHRSNEATAEPPNQTNRPEKRRK